MSTISIAGGAASDWVGAVTDRSALYDRILFFLILSGPPKFRLRDPNASLEGLIDWVILLQLAVWLWAGFWVWRNTREYSKANGSSPFMEDWLGKLSIALIALLALSVLFSEAPAFSAFKVYQLAVLFGFVTLFARKFGVEELFSNLFWACAILALVDVVAAVVMPDLVFVESELGDMRFRGDLLAQTGIVSLIGLCLLLTIKSELPKLKFTFWLVVLGGVLVTSLMRTSYVALLTVLFLAAIRRPAIPLLRRLTTLAIFATPVMANAVLSALDARRQVEDIWTLSDRLGLWSYLIDTAASNGPWLGLGYFAASRVYAPEYNPGLGTAHSAFIEVYVGGGLVSFAIFMCIWVVTALGVWRIYVSRPDKLGFAFVALFCAAFFLNAIGGELQADPAGFCFWAIVAGLSAMTTKSSHNQTVAIA